MPSCPIEMSSPLYGPEPMSALKSMKESVAVGEFGSVLLKNSSTEENVWPPNCPAPGGGGRKKTPCRKMLNELKNENDSKFAPKVRTCLPRNRLKLFVNCHTS